MKKCNKDEKVIFLNREKFIVEEDELTGNQILQLGKLGQDYDLFLAKGQCSEKIEPNQVVKIKNGMRFRVIIKVIPYG